MPRPKTKQPAPLEVVHPLWLLKAIGFAVLAALVCGYITLCLLFYQGQWQLVLHPTRTAQALAGLPGLPGEPARFDAADSGVPRLTGLWIPADPITKYPGLTVLYLRGGEGSLAQDAGDLARIQGLHELGLTVFAFDYRGYGQSEDARPNQARMTEDAAHALRYVTEVRRVPESRILLYGTGVGASLATKLAADHPSIPALVLDAPGTPPIETALADPRTRALPVRMLFHEDFPLTGLTTLKTPKLLVTVQQVPGPPPPAFRDAAPPKTALELSPDHMETMLPALGRFFDGIPQNGGVKE